MKKLFSRPVMVILFGALIAGFLLILVQSNATPGDIFFAEGAQSNQIVLLIGILLVLAAIILAVVVARWSRIPPSEATTGGFATVPFVPSGTQPANTQDTRSAPTRPPTMPTRPQAPIAYLIGPGGQPIVIQHSDFSIGRHRDNHLVVNESHVSRRHARIVMQHGHFMLCNLSQLGTIVNNMPVHQATILQGGEQIRIGNVDFRFTLPTPQAAPSPTRQPL